MRCTRVRNAVYVRGMTNTEQPEPFHPGPTSFPTERDQALENELPWKDEEIKHAFQHVEDMNPLTEPF